MVSGVMRLSAPCAMMALWPLPAFSTLPPEKATMASLPSPPLTAALEVTR